MTTKLDKPLRREVRLEDCVHTLTIDAAGLELAAEVRRIGQTLEWRDLKSSDAALAAGLAADLHAAERRR